MIKISIAQLEHQRRLSLQGEEKPEFLQLADGDIFTAEQPVKYSLDVERVSGGVHVAGSVSSYLSGSCARCLQQTEVLVQNKEIELFFPVGAEEMLDISGDIREELLLNLPMNILCKDDCAGLCPVCGCNNNTTPCSCSREKTEEIPADTDDSPSPWDVLDTLVDK